MKNIVFGILLLIFFTSCTSKNPVNVDIDPQDGRNKLGVNFDKNYCQNNSMPNVLARIDSLASHDIEQITIYRTYYTDGTSSYYLHEEFPSENPGWSNYSYIELAQMVMRAKSYGIRVQYAIEICPIGRGSGWHNGYGEIWRGNFNPSNTQYFFTNFWNKVKVDAQFCEFQGIDILNIGQENILLTTPDKDTYWHTLVDSIKTQYSGPISYYFNGGAYNRYSQQFPDCEFYQVSNNFCSNFDILGMTMYPGLSDEEIPSLNSLKTALSPIFGFCKQIYNQTGVPFVIAETSCPSVKYPLTNGYVGWAWDANTLMGKVTDYTGQANYIKALIELGSGENWLKYIFWHNSYFNPNNPNNSILLEKGPSPFGANLEVKLMLK